MLCRKTSADGSGELHSFKSASGVPWNSFCRQSLNDTV